jgi:hypothetical protein
VLTIQASGSFPIPRGEAMSATVSGACRTYPVSTTTCPSRLFRTTLFDDSQSRTKTCSCGGSEYADMGSSACGGLCADDAARTRRRDRTIVSALDCAPRRSIACRRPMRYAYRLRDQTTCVTIGKTMHIART